MQHLYTNVSLAPDAASADQQNPHKFMQTVWSSDGQLSYQCTVCGRVFKDRSNMKRHIRLHTGERPYRCNICDQEFIQNTSLKMHMFKHTGHTPYVCTICKRQFSCSRSLSAHNQKVHTKSKT